MPKVVEVDVHEASYLVYYSAGKTDMCSQLKVFFSWSITAHSWKWSVVLARLAFYEKMLIGQETSVRVKGVEFRKKSKGFPGRDK